MLDQRKEHALLVAHVKLEPDAEFVEVGDEGVWLLADRGDSGADQDVFEERAEDCWMVGLGDLGVGGEQFGFCLLEV